MSLTPEQEAALISENRALREQLAGLSRLHQESCESHTRLLKDFGAERDQARRASVQALRRINILYSLLSQYPAALGCESIEQYRALLIREFAPRGSRLAQLNRAGASRVQVRASGDGKYIEIGFTTADGLSEGLNRIAPDRARDLIGEIKASLSGIARDPDEIQTAVLEGEHRVGNMR